MAGPLKGILFDLGDTLLDFGKVDVRGFFEAGAHKAYDYLTSLGQPLPSFAAFHRRQLWAIRLNYVKSLITRREFSAMDILDRHTLSMGQRLNAQQSLELAWNWYEPLSRRAKVEPGARELLTELKLQGLRLGLVSNTFVPGEILDRHLRQEDLLDLLDIRVYSCDVRYRKPNPNIFRTALGQLGLAPGDTLFVGDSLVADIDGANRAGLISVLKDPTGRHRHARIQPKYRIQNLGELRDIVDKLRGGRR